MHTKQRLTPAPHYVDYPTSSLHASVQRESRIMFMPSTQSIPQIFHLYASLPQRSPYTPRIDQRIVASPAK